MRPVMRSFDIHAPWSKIALPEEKKYGRYFYDADQRLLYIGITSSPRDRWTGHRGRSPWWPAVAFVSVRHLHDLDQAIAAERKAIRTEHPPHNVREKPGWYPAKAARARAAMTQRHTS